MIFFNRNGDGESIINGKNVRNVAEHHYSNAFILYSQLEHWDEVIRLQLEKAGIYEFQLKSKFKCASMIHISKLIKNLFKGLTGVVSKMRVLQSMLNCYLSTKQSLFALVQSDTSEPSTLDAKTSECLTLMCSRIQSTLLQLNKLAKNLKKP